jgi:serine/threonine protein kinase
LDFLNKKIINDNCNVYCILYEYIEGESFGDYIETCSLEDFKKYFLLIVNILKEAKLQYNYTHGDLHPYNIILEPIGNNEYRPVFVDYHSNSGLSNNKKIQILYEEYEQFEDIEIPKFDDIYCLTVHCALYGNTDVSNYCIKILEYFSIYTTKEELTNYKYFNLPYCKNTCSDKDLLLLKSKYNINALEIWDHDFKYENFDHFICYVKSIKFVRFDL